ncbi:MAG: branched-chain amino acid ABC transporter permease, partial [Gemmatimonadaceae bacterium]|nr:branched-chain amino acid ABC transporter permease [Acetobacteraceae bacterium]
MSLLPFLVSGLGIGAVYALSGVGLTVLFKASGTINFAFGALGALAAHLMWTLVRGGLPEWAGLLAGVAAAAGIAFLYGYLISPLLKNRDSVVRSVATLGLTLILLGTMGLVWGETPRRLTLVTDAFSLPIFGARVNGTRLAALAMTVLGVVGIGLFLAWTRLGLAMRAVANDRNLSELVGVATRRVDAVAWVLSGTFAGLAGVFLANIVRLQPTFLTFLVIPAIAAAIVGRLTSLPGAAAGGLAIGLLEAVLSAFPDLAPYRSVTPYVTAVL